MTFFCTQCWKEIAQDVHICPNCGADQQALSRESYVEKLIRALSDPEPETPIRAAFILGKLRAVEAVPRLIHLAESCPDPYIAAACVQAIGEIGDASALKWLEGLLTTQHSVIIGRAVEDAIRLLKVTAHA